MLNPVIREIWRETFMKEALKRPWMTISTPYDIAAWAHSMSLIAEQFVVVDDDESFAIGL